MKQSQGRIFTTHTGSLPRPDELVQLLAAVARGESVDQSALERLADESTLDVIRKQGAAGIDVVNSGEQSRVSFSTYVTQRMSGFGGSWTRRRPSPGGATDAGHAPMHRTPGIPAPRPGGA
jgi:5-methyltetrahydropteroyltriglutamate--homocysteine methyltransferase